MTQTLQAGLKRAARQSSGRPDNAGSTPYLGETGIEALVLYGGSGQVLAGRGKGESIGDIHTFAQVWKAFKPGEDVPEIDFRSKLALFESKMTAIQDPMKYQEFGKQ